MKGFGFVECRKVLGTGQSGKTKFIFSPYPTSPIWAGDWLGGFGRLISEYGKFSVYVY